MPDVYKVSPLFVLIAMMLAVSCSTEDRKPEEIKVWTTAPTDKKALPLSRLASEVVCVPLETKEEALIGEIVKVIYQDPFIYVADRYALYRFSHTGAFSARLFKQGAGPEEYAGITDFIIDRDGSPWILDRVNKQLLKYSWDNQLLDVIEMDFWPGNVYLQNSRLYVYVGNEAGDGNTEQLKWMDINDKTNWQGDLPIDMRKAGYLHVHSLNHFSNSSDGNSLYFFNVFDDFIYVLSENGSKPVIRLNFDGKNIPASFFEASYDNIAVFFETLFRQNYAYAGGFFLDNKNTGMVSYLYNRTGHWAIIDKTTQKAIYDIIRIDEDVYLAGYPINLTGQKFFIQSDRSLILPLIPDDIMEYMNSNADAAMLAKVKENIKYAAGEDQNPVLLLITMNDFEEE